VAAYFPYCEIGFNLTTKIIKNLFRRKFVHIKSAKSKISGGKFDSIIVHDYIGSIKMVENLQQT
jgi:hypothetical protein